MGVTQCLDPKDPNAVWPYCPSFAGAVAFTALFGAITVGHFIQGFYHKKRFCWVICMASSWETGGFVFRILGAKNPLSQAWIVPSQLLILLAPLWVNAFVYMVVGRMVYFWLPEKKVWKIKATSLTRFFVWADVVVFLIQATGGVMSGIQDNPHTADIGLKIYMGGIGLQQAILLGFLGLMINFHLRALRSGKMHPTSFVPLIYTLYVVLTLITLRIIFRLVEFSSGYYGPIPTHEYFFYVLEATPMFLAILILNIMHPGRYLRGEGSEFTKPLVTKGHRRWWCCGRRKRTRTDPDFELSEGSTEVAKHRHHRSHGDRHHSEE